TALGSESAAETQGGNTASSQTVTENDRRRTQAAPRSRTPFSATPVRNRGPLFRGNPIFDREVLMRLSIRRLNKANRIVGSVVLGLVLPAFHLLFLWIARESMQPKDVRTVALVLETFLVSVLASSLTSSVFSSEREKQTWNALLLSRLSPAQIVVGKFAGGVIPTLLTLAALWPLNLMLAAQGRLPLTNQIAELACLIATVLLSGAIGLFWSWANRRTQAAQVFTAGSVLFLMLGSIIANSLYSAMADNAYGPMMSFVPHWFNPLTVLISVAADPVGGSWNSVAVPVFLVFSTVATALLTAIPILRLGEGPKELEH
ncbi:MAG: ABC transporter permease subunit, partial [Armatimonadaceae bacterium]